MFLIRRPRRPFPLTSLTSAVIKIQECVRHGHLQRLVSGEQTFIDDSNMVAYLLYVTSLSAKKVAVLPPHHSYIALNQPEEERWNTAKVHVSGINIDGYYGKFDVLLIPFAMFPQLSSYEEDQDAEVNNENVQWVQIFDDPIGTANETL